MDTVYKVNDTKCDIRYMHMEVEFVMSSSVTGTAWLISDNF